MSGGGKITADNYLQTAKLFGASRILEKPFTQQQMVEAVKELTNESEKQDC
jgi:FixJ family two-component response regulator